VATSALQTVTLGERPDLVEDLKASGLDGALTWPSFYEGSLVSARYWHRTYTEFADYQVVFVDDGGTIVACGHTAPLHWDGTPEGLPSGWDAGLEQAFAANRRPNTLMALSAVAHPSRRRSGLGAEILKSMRSLAASKGFGSVIAPVRPNRKESYPLAKFEEYISWTHPDGSAFDPWLRVHLQLGGHVLMLAPESMVVEGTVEQWTRWTGGSFPASGAYVVPGALAPVHIDLERDLGRYIEPNVWVEHRLAEEPHLG
jgi:GNAT superfamily N-acetyltransferase